MASEHVDVELDLRELIQRLNSTGGRVQNLRRKMPVIRDALVATVDDVIDAEGPGWAPMAVKGATNPATGRPYTRTGRSGKLLQDNSLLAKIGGGYGNDFARAYSPADYAKFHVNGTKYLPVRNPFDLGPFEEPLLREVEQILFDEVVGA